MKFIALIMIIASGVLIGTDKYKDMENKVKVLEFYESLLNEIKIGISYSLDDIYLILTESANPVAIKIRGDNLFSENLDIRWKETAEYLLKNDSEVRFISRFIEEFGKTDIESGKLITDNYLKKVHMKCVAAKGELEKKGKIYIVYSFFISFSVAMLLI